MLDQIEKQFRELKELEAESKAARVKYRKARADIIAAFKSIPYKEYLQTTHWKRVRSKAHKRAGYACQLCGNSHDTLHVHHRTYERFGMERPKDLIVLCQQCHAKHHDR